MRINFRFTIYLLFVLFFAIKANAQEYFYKSKLITHNYTTADFNSAPQIWAGAQAKYGAYVFANNTRIIKYNGSKEYQGEDWSDLKVDTSLVIPEKDFFKENKVSFFYKSKNGEIYVGRKNNFGILAYDSNGNLIYKPYIIDNSFGDVMNITDGREGEIVVTTENSILVYNIDGEILEATIPIGKGASEIKLAFSIKEGVVLSVEKKLENVKNIEFYFYSFSKQSFNKINAPQYLSEDRLRSAFTDGSNRYIVSENNGFFSFSIINNNLVLSLARPKTWRKFESGYNITKVEKFDNLLWIATGRNGIVVTNFNGEIISSYSNATGLQDNNVFDFFFDDKGLLWVCTTKGISTIETQSPLAYWGSDAKLTAAVEKINVTNKYIELATQNDIFRSFTDEKSSIQFKNTKLIDESTYDLINFSYNGITSKLVVGYNGIYQLFKDDSKKYIGPDVYAYSLYQSKYDSSKVFVGGENFLGLLQYKDENWSYTLLKDSLEEIRSFVEKGKYLYFGVKELTFFKLDVSDPNHKLEQITLAEGTEFAGPAPQLVNFKNRIIVGTNDCLGEIDAKEVRNIKFKDLDTTNSTSTILYRLYNQNDEKLWASLYVENKKLQSVWDFGYFTLEDDVFIWHSIYNKRDFDKIGLMNSIDVFSNEVFVGGTSGLLVFNEENYEKINQPWSIYLGYSIITDGDSLKMIRESNKDKSVVFEHGKTVYCKFTSYNPYNRGLTEYRTRLIGFSNQWSEYTEVDFKDFQKLSHGEYKLQIQGRDYYGNESEMLEFSFRVLPPWYYTWWAYLLYFLVGVLLLLLVIRLSISRVKKQNKRLEETVEERTSEIAAQNSILEIQKDEITEKNNDILDSIKYAKRIQNTILPSSERLNSFFKEHFVYYRPKDIVSGDFYWSREVAGKILWAAVDCTGHGVPGAFVSIVGNNGLIRATSEFKLNKPGEVLDKLREITIESFKAQGQSEVKDGMDLSLCAIDKTTNTLEFSGANNPLIIVRNGELIEYKGSKQPIGEFTNPIPFETHTIQLEPGDCIYLYSDGYVDQFGGVKGKKLKSRPFKNFLLEIYEMPMQEQLFLLDKHFKDWKGDLEQIDDVCVFGVRV